MEKVLPFLLIFNIFKYFETSSWGNGIFGFLYENNNSIDVIDVCSQNFFF